jgi:heat shock protein HslJ
MSRTNGSRDETRQRQWVALLAGLLLVALMAACAPAVGPAGPQATAGTTTSPPPGRPMALDGTRWELVSLNGQRPVEGSGATIAFYPENYLEGTSGCNSFGADYAVRGQEFHVSEIHRNVLDCGGPPGIMEQDEIFFEALANIAVHQATEDRLIFENAGGETILIYTRKLPPTVDPALQGTEWILTELRSRDLVAGSHIQLNLDREGFDGFAGCNRYGGEYEAADRGALKVDEFAITAMACSTPQGVMEQEQVYVEALREASAYRLRGDRLEIQNAAGETILVYVRQETFEGNPTDLSGTAWQLVSMDDQDFIKGSPITLVFHNEQRVSGYAGCRDYVATYQASGGDLGFLFMGMMGPVCLEDALLEREGAYTTMLGWTAHFRLNEGQLELLTIRGETLIFEPLPPEVQAGLEGPTWKLLSFIEPNPYDESPSPAPLLTDVLEGTEITAVFEESTVHGSGGCNQYSGTCRREGNSLTVDGVVATEMACLDPAGIMEQEQRYLDLLSSVTTCHVYGSQLWLETGDGQALVFSTRMPRYSPEAGEP